MAPRPRNLQEFGDRLSIENFMPIEYKRLILASRKSAPVARRITVLVMLFTSAVAPVVRDDRFCKYMGAFGVTLLTLLAAILWFRNTRVQLSKNKNEH